MLKNILRFGQKNPDGRIGYSYVANSDDGPMSEVQIGQVVAVEGRGPPWIVVDEDPTTATLAGWPGRLWSVSIIEAAATKNQPYPTARYTRSLSVRVLKEENLAALFGEHGEAVVMILEKAMELNHEMALSMSMVRHPEASAAYDRVFRLWANAEKLNLDSDGSLDGTLKIGSMPHGSPIYNGLIILHTVIFQRAKAIDGKAATTIDDEDEYLNDPWRTAGAVLGDAALALGAPEFLSAEDRSILLNGWTDA